jgi:hypothetical protein
MSATSPEENILHVSTSNKEPISLRLETGVPVRIRIEIENNCTCTCTRAGSYTDTQHGSVG